MSIDTAVEIAEGLKSEKTFDARKAITGATYPTDSIDVYSDAALAHELNLVANDAAKARFLADTIKNAYANEQSSHKPVSIEDEPYAGDGTEAPGWDNANEVALIFESEVAEQVKALRDSVLTFHVRGLAPAQWRLIDAKWRKAIKPPARKNYPQTEDGEEEYELAVHERNIARNAAINNDMIASAITKVVRKVDGAEDTHTWTQEDVAEINDFYPESEYEKIKSLVEQLTFARNLFNIAVEQDADFLSKP